MKQTAHPWRLSSLTQNLRFYILTASFLVSLVILAWLRIQIVADQLYIIRLEQVYGFLSTIYLYIALMISPLLMLPLREALKRQLKFSRRSIGVSAAYFALLHSGIALWGQIGGLDKLAFLPAKLVWSLSGGGVGLVILLIMAATSFDKVVRGMTFPWWKWLQRLGYAAALLTILHVWLIGTHLAYSWAQWTGVIALTVLFGFESFRIARTVTRRLHAGQIVLVTICLLLWVGSTTALVMMPRYLKNYHSDQHSGGGQVHGGASHE